MRYKQNQILSQTEIKRTSTVLSSSGGVVSPLAGRRSPTDDILGFGLAELVKRSSFNQLCQMYGVRIVSSIGLAYFLVLSDVFDYVYLGLSITAIFCYPMGRLHKRRSSLGHFLNASFHFTKNSPMSQRVFPFEIPLSGLPTAVASSDFLSVRVAKIKIKVELNEI